MQQRSGINLTNQALNRLLVKNGQDPISLCIKFNRTQKEYWNTIFDYNGRIRTDNNLKEFVFFGGYRAGKSFIQQLAIFYTCCNYPKIRCVYVRNTYDELKDTVIKQFKEVFDPINGTEQELNTYYTYIDSSKDGSHIAKFRNGSEIRFRSADMPTKLLSAEYDLIALCQAEAIPEDVYNLLTGRWSGRRLPKKLILMEGNPAGTWVKRNYKDKDNQELLAKGVYFKEVQTFENVHNLDPDYIEDFKNKNSDRDYRRFILSEWDSVDDMVFAEFRSAVNIIDPISPYNISLHHKKAMGGDYGNRNPAAFVYGFKDFDDNYIIYDEWYEKEQTPDQIIAAGLKYGKQPIAYDYAIKGDIREHTATSKKSLWDLLTRGGLMLIESNKDELRNIALVNQLFKQGRIKICSNCVNLIWEIQNYKFPAYRIGSEKALNEKPIDKDNHAIDSLLYFANYMEDTHSKQPEAIPYNKTLEYRTHKRTVPSIYRKLG